MQEDITDEELMEAIKTGSLGLRSGLIQHLEGITPEELSASLKTQEEEVDENYEDDSYLEEDYDNTDEEEDLDEEDEDYWEEEEKAYEESFDIGYEQGYIAGQAIANGTAIDNCVSDYHGDNDNAYLEGYERGFQEGKES